MITKNQAQTAQEFHRNGCSRTKGPRGGITESVEVWRSNGQTQVWKTRPKDFRVPVKYGMRSYGNITQDNARDFHLPSDCPIR